MRSLTFFASRFCLLVSFASSISFGVREAQEIVYDGGFKNHYSNTIWEYLESLTYLFVFLSSLLTGLGIVASNIFNSFALLFAWITLLAHIRGYKAVGSLLKKLLRIFSDMKIYMAIQVIVLIGFALSFKVLLPGHEAWENWHAFLSVFRMMTGDVDQDAFVTSHTSDVTWKKTTTSIAHSLYVTYTLGIVIVMLNMLIAQMGDSFDHVQEHERIEALRERAVVLHQMLRYEMRKKRDDSIWFPNWLHVLTSEEGVSLKKAWGSVGRSFEEYSEERKLKS